MTALQLLAIGGSRFSSAAGGHGLIEAGDAISVINGVIPFLAMLVASLLLDSAVWPRTAQMRRWQGVLLHLLVLTALFGLCLAGSGNTPVAAVLATALMLLFTIASNAKHKMLGEPLVFSDLALIVGIMRHPRFYFTAISARQRWMLAIGASIAIVVLALMFSARLQNHLAGAGLLLFAGGAPQIRSPAPRSRQ